MVISNDTIVTITSIITAIGGPGFYFFKRFIKSNDKVFDQIGTVTTRLIDLEKQTAVSEAKSLDARAAKTDLDELRRTVIMLESKSQAAFRIIDQMVAEIKELRNHQNN